MRDWLDDYVPIDPLLTEPLDLYGDKARRRTQVEALVRALGFEHRLDDGRISEETLCFLFPMLERLVESLDKRRCHLRDRSRSTVVGVREFGDCGLSWTHTAQAVLDFGWSHEHIASGDAREVLQAIHDVYVEHNTAKVLAMLRHWERQGWIYDSAA